MTDSELLAFVRKPGVFTALEAEHDRPGWRNWASDLLLLVGREGCGSHACSPNAYDCRISPDTMGCEACVASLTRCPYLIDFIAQRVRDHTALTGRSLQAFMDSYERWRLLAIEHPGVPTLISRATRGFTLFDDKASNIRNLAGSLPGQIERLRAIVTELRVSYFDLCANYTPLLLRTTNLSTTTAEVHALLLQLSSSLPPHLEGPALPLLSEAIAMLESSMQSDTTSFQSP
ncbi:hypothetical protein CC1G_04108 [Coprinopsis cinerea okayama7|uniref:Uncharacterized protein n=1 Tax=Coprinopsis cinerea (strain Okayama-7 / 130 / ATCC MYA-4618 / FGSC 9003) TaxID=240176 RepID=A8NW05_COPC7|nr:hypothetical protein CC1G_04108 [Coprinopsis cinerea okayama7\|eukprot:XP_001836795.2 hypothetical protein CC1G_04108 [Coprinopsis cinerea okayama7\